MYNKKMFITPFYEKVTSQFQKLIINSGCDKNTHIENVSLLFFNAALDHTFVETKDMIMY
jgi:hypothetical protein